MIDSKKPLPEDGDDFGEGDSACWWCCERDVCDVGVMRIVMKMVVATAGDDGAGAGHDGNGCCGGDASDDAGWRRFCGW